MFSIMRKRCLGKTSIAMRAHARTHTYMTEKLDREGVINLSCHAEKPLVFVIHRHKSDCVGAHADLHCWHILWCIFLTLQHQSDPPLCYATSVDLDQPAHPHCLIILHPSLTLYKLWGFYSVYHDAQADLGLRRSQMRSGRILFCEAQCLEQRWLEVIATDF